VAGKSSLDMEPVTAFLENAWDLRTGNVTDIDAQYRHHPLRYGVVLRTLGDLAVQKRDQRLQVVGDDGQDQPRLGRPVRGGTADDREVLTRVPASWTTAASQGGRRDGSGVIARRLTTMGVAIVFVGSVRALEAAGVEYAVGDCLVAAAVATLLTTAWTSS